MKIQLLISLFLLMLIWVSSESNIAAAESEPNLPVEWDSDGPLNVRIENDIRLVEMQDNVKVTQGGLLISGDQAVFEYTIDTNDLIRVTVHGSPVLYQQNSASDEPVTGNSDTIILYEDEVTLNMMVEMVGNATIRTMDSTTNCVGIIYDTVLSIIPSSTPPCSGSFSSPPN